MRLQIIITMPTAESDRILLHLGVQSPGDMALCWCGECRREGWLEFIHRLTVYTHRVRGYLREMARAGLRPVLVVYGSWARNRADVERYVSSLQWAGIETGALLQLVRTGPVVSAYGWMKEGDRFLPIDALSLPGHGMQKMSVGPVWPLPDAESKASNNTRASGRTGDNSKTWQPDLSRLEGFLGEGDIKRGKEILLRASQLSVAVIGCGRAGLLLVIRLVQSGVARYVRLYLIDGDNVGKENLDVMLLPPWTVGMPKALAAAKLALNLDPGANVVPIVGTITDRQAAKAVIASEVTFTCVDNDAARLAAAIMTALYGRVHFDMSGGPAYTRSHDTAVGGHALLALPGSRRCVACMRGIDWDGTMEQLRRTAEEERQSRQSADFLGERPGSSGEVLYLVVGTGMLLFWRLLQDRQRESVHIRLDANGALPDWDDRTFTARSESCLVCSENGIRGLGDRGMKYE